MMEQLIKYIRIKNDNKFIQFCLEHGFKTGSSLFGYKYNDIDVVVKAMDLENYCPDYKNKYAISNYLGNDKFRFIDLKLKDYDFIIVSRIEFKIWKFATDTMMELLKDQDFFDLCESKSIRVFYFKRIKEYYYGKKFE